MSDTKPTVEELRAQVMKEYPYIVGDGTKSVARQATALKRLMRKYNYPIEIPRMGPMPLIGSDYGLPRED
jgi:hypothetical protein